MTHLSMSTYILYARKSTESEDRQILSIPAQIEELRSLASHRGIIDVRVVEESKSAKAPGRPAFSSLLQEIDQGKVRGIICWKLDRLARNPVDGGAVIWALARKKLVEISGRRPP